jgi:hypothetical protein
MRSDLITLQIELKLEMSAVGPGSCMLSSTKVTKVGRGELKLLGTPIGFGPITIGHLLLEAAYLESKRAAPF